MFGEKERSEEADHACFFDEGEVYTAERGGGEGVACCVDYMI